MNNVNTFIKCISILNPHNKANIDFLKGRRGEI
jgi:hypothetical protein